MEEIIENAQMDNNEEKDNTSSIFKCPMEEMILQLQSHNEKLQDENTKFQRKIILLEKNLNDLREKTYVPLNDTSNNFFLTSEIKSLWETIAEECIGDCFIEIFTQPLIVFNIIQEMFFIMIKMIRDKIDNFTDKMIKKLGIKTDNQKQNQKLKLNLFTHIRPFLQEHLYDIFINNTSDNFNEIYINKFISFYNKEIAIILSNNNDKFNILDIIKGSTFTKLILNIKKIILFVELNFKRLNFNVEDYNTRELKFEQPNIKDNDVLNVNGITQLNQLKLILLSPPKMENGLPYQNLKNIILPCEPDSIKFSNAIYSNCPSTPKGINIRSTLYHNIYHHKTVKKEEEEKANKTRYAIDDNDNNITKEDNKDIYYYDMTPLNMKISQSTKSTKQISNMLQFKNKGNIIEMKNKENIDMNNMLNKSHIQNLSKPTLSNASINSNKQFSKSHRYVYGKMLLNKNISSVKITKLYHSKKQGSSSVHLEQLIPNSSIYDINQLSKNKEVKGKSKDNNYRNTITLNNKDKGNMKSITYVRTNDNNNKKEYFIENIRAHKMFRNIKDFKGILKKKHLNSKNYHRRGQSANKKKSNIEKSISKFKLSASIKVNQEEVFGAKQYELRKGLL